MWRLHVVELKTMRITIGSPIYERPEPAFVTCLIATLDLLRERGHHADWRYASSVVHYGRNFLMHDMLRHQPDVLVQLDTDHQWEAGDLVDAIETVVEGHADVIGFAYLDRKRNSIHQTPSWTSPMIYNAPKPGFEREGKRYIEVDAVGGGLLVTSRACIEKMSEGAPRQYLGDAPMLFDFQGDVGEDRYFCDRWRSMGGKVHCDMTSLIGHIGRTVYAMSPSRILPELEFGDD
jgi:hypothetical protein